MYIYIPFIFFGIFIGLMIWVEVLEARAYREIRRDKVIERLYNMKEMS